MKGEVVAVYRCNRCGNAAFMLRHTLRFGDPISLSFVDAMHLDGTKGQVGELILCDVCGEIPFTPGGARAEDVIETDVHCDECSRPIICSDRSWPERVTCPICTGDYKHYSKLLPLYRGDSGNDPLARRIPDVEDAVDTKGDD